MALLSAKGIYKQYCSFYALRPCDLSFPSKGLFAIKGKSGSGKSTLLNLLSGIERPNGGNVFLRGQDIAGLKHTLLGHEAAMVFQHYNLIEGESALYNAALPSLMGGKGMGKAKSLLKQFGLGPLMRKNVSRLSGGERQRVAICRALVNDPDILFADEPTGALDERNSVEVMEALAFIAKSRLVLFVSHNEELIQRYAQGVVEIRDGRVASSTVSKEKETAPKKKRFGHSPLWTGRFVWRNLKKNWLKDLTCFAAGMTGFCSVVLSVGFFVGNGPAFAEEQSHTLFYPCATISKRTEIEVPGSNLTLVQKKRPSKDDVALRLGEGIDVYVADDYSYFFPGMMTFGYRELQQEPTLFQPLLDFSLSWHGLDMVQQGRRPNGGSLSECLVNEEFATKFGTDCLGETLSLSARSTVTFNGKQNEVFVEAKMVIVGIVREFAFLNSPRVYYSYQALGDRLKNLFVEDDEGGRETVADLVEIAPDDSPYANYDRLLFLGDEPSVNKLFSLIEEGVVDELEIVSQAQSLRASFDGLSSAFTSSLGLFVGIALVGLAMILGMSSLSSYVSGRKEAAVLRVLGAKGGEIYSIYMVEAALLCVASAVASIALVPLLQRILNALLRQKFDVSNLIRVPLWEYAGVSFFLPLVLIGAALFLGLFASLIPMVVNKGAPIAVELRDE